METSNFLSRYLKLDIIWGQMKKIWMLAQVLVRFRHYFFSNLVWLMDPPPPMGPKTGALA